MLKQLIFYTDSYIVLTPFIMPMEPTFLIQPEKRSEFGIQVYPRFRTQIKKMNIIKQLPRLFLRLHIL